ncbi:AMSH-like ubiquitin thioesterase 3-like protein, partial [Drosera capensis]
MTQPARPIDVSAITRKIDVDNRIPLRRYYRSANTLLKQADIYRGEKNVIDLYIMLLRYSSLVSETIPLHRDYQILHSREKAYYRKKLFEVIDELESLKPEFQLRLDELNKTYIGNRGYQSDGPVRSMNGSEVSSLRLNPSYSRSTPRLETIQSQPANRTLTSSWKKDGDHNQVVSSNSMPLDMKFQKLSLNLPLPKQETLSRHSFLGPNGLRRQWQGPTTEIKVRYPSYTDLTPLEDLSLIQARESEAAVANDEKSGRDESLMQEVLSLNDGKWSQTADELCPPQGNLWQPTPPPVLAEVHPEVRAISPSRVADPRPGPARSSPDGIPGSNSYQNLHIPVRMLEDFLRLAQKNTSNNLETCGVLAGSLKNRTFHITTLIVPKQESTSDS